MSEHVEVDVLSADLRLQFVSGLCLVERDRTTLQIGSDLPYCAVVHNAPPGAAVLLKALDGLRPTHEALLKLSERPGVELAAWAKFLGGLLTAGFLVKVAPSGTDRKIAEAACVHADRQALTIRFGPEAAAQAMRNRQEAVVQIVGAGRVAASMASLLAGAGVGHIHIEPNRLLRPGDICAAGVGHAGLESDSTVVGEAGARNRGAGAGGRAGRSAALSRPGAGTTGGRKATAIAPQSTTGMCSEQDSHQARQLMDRRALAQVVQRVAPQAAVHPPAGYVPPNLVVVAGDGPVDAALLAGLHDRGIPHLAIRTTELTAVVGPFVVPARTSCVNCGHLYRADLDPAWPMIMLALNHQQSVPSSTHAAAVAAAGAGQVLQYLDGIEPPDTIDGTLEWDSDSWLVRRRSWTIHPRCSCRR